MFVHEILRRKGAGAKRLGPDEPLETAAAIMRLEGIGALVVCGPEGRLEGMISERDIVHAIVDDGPRALSRPVSKYMRTRIVTCSGSDPVAKVARSMTLHRARHVPVLEGGTVAGVISVGDLVRERLEEIELERDALRDLALSRQLAG